MKTVYNMMDVNGREMTSTFEDGVLKVTMSFQPQEELTIEDLCEKMDWVILNQTEYKDAKVIPFKRKDY